MLRIAFVQSIAFEYLGVMYLSAVLKNSGHAVDIFIEQGQGPDKLVEEIKSFNPDIIGFSCTTGLHHWALQVAGLVKKTHSRAKIIFGGPHPTFFPEIIRENVVDILCRGEGEGALLDLVERINKGNNYCDIPNLWVKQNGHIWKNDVRPLMDLDRVPFPDRTIYVKKYPFLNKSQKVFITGRGCPFSCSYCFNHAFKKIYKDKGVFVRQRNTDNVIKEIQEVKSSARLKTVYIQDDTFGLNKKWTLEFLKKYKTNIAIPFICLLRADLADEEIIKNLKNAGCLNVFFGVETGSENIRTFLLKKTITNDQIYKSSSLLKKYRIKFRTYNMLGLPQESLEEALKTVELNIKIKTDYPWSSLLQPFPGTELGEYVKEHNLVEGNVCQFNPSFFKNSNIKLKQKREIENLHKLFFFAVKFPFSLPAIKWLIKKDFRLLYDLLFLLGYMYSFKKSEGISWIETIRIGKSNLKNFFFHKHS